MDILAFTLKGRTAFFKNPEVNTYANFTYSTIPKTALTGLLGAIAGYAGYSTWDKEKDDMPEFYQRLKNIHCAIVPLSTDGVFHKKIQTFNNSVGYANENGGNLIVKEQWIENPAWRIYLQIEEGITNEVVEHILNNSAIYLPYFGKNDHPADIVDVRRIMNAKITDEYYQIHSIVKKDNITFGDIEDYEDELENSMNDTTWNLYKYEERLPILFDAQTGMYITQNFVLTNHPITDCMDEVYCLEGKNVVFF